MSHAGAGEELFDVRLARIRERFRRSSRTVLRFYGNDRGDRVQVTLSRSRLSSQRVECTTVTGAQFYGITPLEQEIATAVALGFGNEEIGRQRGTSKRTVDRHVSNILARLGFHNRAELAAFLAAADGWMVPFPASSVLERTVPAIGILGLSTDRNEPDHEEQRPEAPTLLLGSLLPADEKKQQDALAMSRGEDLAAAGSPAGTSAGARFPVQVQRHFVTADELESAIQDLLAGGVRALMIGNFDIPTATRILEHEGLRGMPIVHSMVYKQVDVFTGPDPSYGHIFQMCADEFVYLRALAAYVREHTPDASRLAVLIRDSVPQGAAELIRSAMGEAENMSIKVIRVDEGYGNLAEIALELLHFSPEVVYIGVYVETALVELLSHIRALRLDPHLFCVWVPGIPGFIQRNQELAEGLTWSTLVGNSNNYHGVRFRAAFETTFRADPGIGAAAVHYDMVNLLRRAWQDSGLGDSPGDICDSLHSVQFTGVTGTFHFDNGRRRTLCYPFDTDDPSIGQPCLTFEIRRGKSVPLSLSSA